jgi:hypothetical protein
MQVESGKTYIGVVEDNEDPKRLGRVKARVLDVFDNTKIEDIPWANPWKDLAGNDFALPEKGKVVIVIFENANLNSPEFIYSDHYNVNLEKKLTQVSKEDYVSMKSLIFDHKTQVYVNDSEGLKLDHKFNNINIKEKTIDINLKDNFGKINLGTANSTQRTILGDNFLNWFDDFVQILMGSKGGPFLGNLGAPVVATPALLGSLQLYQQLKDPKFLSKNVYAVDNENVAKLERIAEGQKGDVWQSTVKPNEVTSKEPVPFTPTAGSSDTTFDQKPMDTPAPVVASQSTAPGSSQSVAPAKAEEPKPIPVENPDVKVIIELLNIKKYVLYTEVNKLNIVAIRTQCLTTGDKYSDQFVDKLYVMFKKEDDTWELKQYMFSTVPGLEFTITDSWLSDKNFTNQNPWIGSSGKKISMKEYVKTAGQINGDPVLKNGLPILVPSQYIDVYYVSDYKGALAMKTVKGAKQLIWRDIDSDNFDTFNPSNLTAPEEITPNDFIDNGIKIHLGYPGGQKVGNWSEGSQVFSNAENLNEFFGYCDKHKKLYDNKFTYTLATKNDWDEATKNVSADKPANVLATQSATQSATIASTQSGTQSGTQSAVEATIEQNKSGDIDVVGDGSLIVECIIQDVILTGSITTDDISRLNSEAIKFSIKSQSVPGEWSMTSASLSYSNSNDVEHGMSVPISSNVFILDIKKSIEEQPNKDKVIGDYKLKIDLTFVKKSNNSEKIINKAIQFKITKGSSSTSETKTETKPSNEYIIAILNPTTPNSKNVTGKITISKKGPQYTATGVISGFPDGGSIGPISGQPLSSGDESVNPLVNEMMRILENEMISKYKVEVKLVVTDKK